MNGWELYSKSHTCFRGTIWSNLTYGRPDTTVEEGLSAAKAAGAHDFICRSSLGYETQLGERGSGLSGGEKQRLSIARTLLYDPKILVLDEATSNIDAEAEKQIQEALDVLVRGRTTIAIAHRLSTLRNADRILVFDRGRLVEHGSHQELLSRDGVYARLVRIQTQVTKDPNVDHLVHHVEETSTDEPPREAESRTTSGQDQHEDQNEDQNEDQHEPEPHTKPQNEVRWLDPDCGAFVSSAGDVLQWIEHDTQQPHHVFVVRAFPATRAESYLSVRGWDENGDDYEIGMLRDLDDWSEMDRRVVREALQRRYLLRRITRVLNLELVAGFLEYDVECDGDRVEFLSRWTQAKAIEFGDNGKLIIDTDNNRYVVGDIDQLPTKDRNRFQQYVYW